MTKQKNSVDTENGDVEIVLMEDDKKLIENLNKIKSNLESIKSKDQNTLEKLKVSFEKSELDEVIFSLNESINPSLKIINDLKENFIKLPEFAKKYIYSQVDTAIQYFESLFIHEKSKQNFKETFGIINSYLFYSQQFLYRVQSEKNRFNEEINKYYMSTLQNEFNDIGDIKKKVQEVLFDIQESYELIKNAQTGSVYMEAFNNYNKNSVNFRKLFYISILITFTFVIFYGSPNFTTTENIVSFILYKLTIFILGGSLIAYFLNLSNFYHLKAEQAYQTHLEIKAFPSYVTGLNSNDILSLRKDLAPLYFGKAIDDKMHSGMNNILQDQVKASTDAIKAATDLMKVSSSLGAGAGTGTGTR